MSRALIVHGTTEGQTLKIAEAIGRTLAKAGHSYEIVSGRDAPRGDALKKYDGIIVGSSVHMTQFNTDIQGFVSRNAELLGKKPTAFYSVCLGILEKESKAPAEERRIVNELYAKSGWKPGMDAIFAGALKYTQYGWVKRQMMKLIAKRAGGDTDTSRDYEYTDWAEVEAFARRFADALVPSVVTERARRA